ncbi:MAG: ThiF family adenylyltransferase, partial [Alphaproteobacteria bacterium]|nr:ThiF family adenylyltransferase [Alphaproteobacteria bacterium]
MPDRLHRCRLLIGEENLEKLQHATVMVVGCGAVGSFAIEALARSGIGHIILVDFDKIEE